MPFHETDRVSLRHVVDDTVFVGLFGGGVKFFVTSRSGIRADVRIHLGQTTVQTLLSANPEVDKITSPELGTFLWITTDPSVRFANGSFGGVESSLSGPDITDFEAFEVSGVTRQVLASVGYFFRF